MEIVDRMWPVLNRLMSVHTVVYRATRGCIGHSFPGVGSMLLLDHVGAKSGTKRTIPLLYVADGDDVAIIASKGGHPKHPAWFHNLRANPDTTIQIGSRRRAVHARVATPQERARLWAMAVETYDGYRGYQERAEREIPVVVLEPRVA